MRLIGTDSTVGGCPTLYELDDGRVVVQGQRLTDPEALADARDVLAGETFVVVDADLLNHHWAQRS